MSKYNPGLTKQTQFFQMEFESNGAFDLTNRTIMNDIVYATGIAGGGGGAGHERTGEDVQESGWGGCAGEPCIMLPIDITQEGPHDLLYVELGDGGPGGGSGDELATLEGDPTRIWGNDTPDPAGELLLELVGGTGGNSIFFLDTPFTAGDVDDHRHGNNAAFPGHGSPFGRSKDPFDMDDPAPGVGGYGGAQTGINSAFDGGPGGDGYMMLSWFEAS